MVDRSGRTYEEYRQLYWDERDRVAELELAVKRANERADKAAQDGWLKTAETQLARAKKAEELNVELQTERDEWVKDNVKLEARITKLEANINRLIIVYMNAVLA